MPTSAWARAGASLMPSPTMATIFPSSWSLRASAALSWGSTSARTRSMPSSRPMASAVRRLSPVIIATSMPSRLSSRTARTEVSFSVSATATRPRGRPSTATNITVFPSPSSRSASGSSPSRETPRSAISLRFPRRTAAPLRLASTPWPGTAWKLSAACTSMPRAAAPRTIASPRGCSEFFSAAAARRRTSSELPSAATTSVTEGSPLVRVPVLSKTTTCTFAVVSTASAPLNRMPNSAPLPVPAIIALGVASPTAQGQEMTRTVTEMSSARPNTPRSSSL